MKKWVLCFWLSLALCTARAQKYLVFFKHKAPTTFSLSNPNAFLSQRALVRRQRYNIALDSTDLPVPASYLESLGQIPGVRVLNVSKWFNSASIQISDPSALQQVQQLPFVQQQQRVGSNIVPNKRSQKQLLGKSGKHLGTKPPGISGTTDYRLQYGFSEAQVHLHNGQFLHQLGLRGQGIQIGMLDAGFFRYTTLPAFDSARLSGRILGTWDFVAGEASVTEDHPHGMQCFSIIAANIPGQLVGTAPYASFYLYRSEDAATETLIEEHNWICAAERLDSAGGDLLSSSLGYNLFDNAADNHRYADLNGNTTFVARGADLAAKKGLLVVNSVGNSGNDSWKYLVTPADGDSVLAVGAVNTRGQVGSFSSYGPAADGRIKPDVASVGVGTYLQANNGGITAGNGTSYAAPNLAGLAACLWQGFPEANNMAVIQALRQSGSQAQAPDNRVGYGIPDVKKAMGILLKQFAQASIQVQGCRATISWQSKDMAAIRYVIERLDPGSNTFITVGEQNGTGTSWGVRNYQFSDKLEGLGAGTLSYRILQVLDTSSTASYSVYIDTVTAALQPSCGLGSRFSIMPNPVPRQFILQTHFEEAIEALQVALINSAGQQVQVLRFAKPAGTANFPINVAHLAAGKYYLRVWTRDGSATTIEFLKL